MKGQLRIYCVNDFDAKREPADDVPILAKRAGNPSYVTHSDFMKMLEIAWFQEENTESNIMAVLKRTHLFVNTKTFLYVRPAGEEKQPVLRLPLNDKVDFLVEDSRLKYDYYRKGGNDLPKDFEQNLQWEAKWMEAAMQGKKGDQLPQRVLIQVPTPLFLSSTRSTAVPESRSSGLYSAEKVGAGLAESIGFTSELFAAAMETSLPASAAPKAMATSLPSSSSATPKAMAMSPAGQSLRHQTTFSHNLKSTADVIDISDSPVKAPPVSQKRAIPLLAVKQELEEEENCKKLRTSLNMNLSQDDMQEETESIIAAGAEHEGDPLQKALENEMDLTDALNADADAQLAEGGIAKDTA